MIHESCSVLEEQLEQLQRKAGAHFDVEQKLTECQNQVKLHLNDLAEVGNGPAFIFTLIFHFYFSCEVFLLSKMFTESVLLLGITLYKLLQF